MELKYVLLKERLTAVGRSIVATNLVRNELNGRRLRDEIVYTVPGRKAYFPRQFPEGRWKVTGVIEHPDSVGDSYLYPYFISTDAFQEVGVYSVVNGLYGQRVGVEMDSGYGIHHSDSSTTLGCIRVVDEEDLRWLVGVVREFMHEGVFLVVER